MDFRAVGVAKSDVQISEDGFVVISNIPINAAISIFVFLQDQTPELE